MKNKLFKSVPALVLAATLAAGTFAFAACGDPEEKGPETQLPPGAQIEGLTDKPLEGDYLADFREGESENFFESDGWSNSTGTEEGPFNTWWKADRVQYNEDSMKLSIADNPDGAEATYNEYFGGEARTYGHYGYGDYEVRMKPAKKVGTASTFFTCTGDYDIDPATNKKNPWDEIDIEFLGKDTTKVQFNYYINGQGGHEYMYDLGFDASEEFHNYGFRWEEDAITWFVDGEPVFKINGSEDVPIPSAAGRILMNYWCGTQYAEGWMGAYSDPGNEGAEYEWVKTNAQKIWTDDNDPTLPKEPIVKFAGTWGNAITPAFTSSTEGLYTVTTEGTTSNITYTNVEASTYQNVTMPVTEAAADMNWVTLKIKNNATETTPNIRINVVNTEGTEAIVLNDYGYCGDDELEKDAGNFVQVAPNETKEIVIKYKGTATNLELMLDSTNKNATGTYAGDVTVSDIKFGKDGEIEEIPQAPDPITINGEQVNIGGSLLSNGGGLYNVKNVANGINVTYEGVKGTDYTNVELQPTALTAANNTFTAKITNNGTQPVNVRVNIQKSDNSADCNLSATMDGVEVFTDETYGGSMFDNIAANKTVTIVVKYDSTNAKNIQFMIDSHKGDTTAHSGDITITDISFSNDGTTVPDPTPEPPVTIPEGGNVDLTFGSTEVYTVDKNGQAADSVNVTYTDIAGGTYKNIVSTDAAKYANVEGIDTFTMTIANKGTAAVTVRVDLISTNKVTSGDNPNYEQCNVSHKVIGGTDAGDTQTEWGGTTVTVAAGETITLIITYQITEAQGPVNRLQIYFDTSINEDTKTYSGNVTISGFKFTSSTAAAE